MKRSERNTDVTFIKKHLTHYYRLNKSTKGNWWDLDEVFSTKNLHLTKYFKDISLIRIMQTKTMIFQKKTDKTGRLALRVAIPSRRDQYWIGAFKDATEGAILLVTHRKLPFIEVFIAEGVTDNGFTLMQLFCSNELDDEIKEWRVGHDMMGKAD